MKLFKTTLILISFFLLCSVGIQAQSLTNTDGTLANDTLSSSKNVSLLSPKRMSFKLDLGVGYVGGSNSGMYTYLAPYLRYSLTPKLKLDVGGILCDGISGMSGSYNSTSFLLFAKGNYLLTDKLTVSGTAYKTFYPNTSLYSESINKNSTDNYGFSLGMDYKITKNLSFGAQVIMAKGYNNNNLFQSQPSLFGGFPSDNPHNGIFGW
jgi:predicted porin